MDRGSCQKRPWQGPHAKHSRAKQKMLLCPRTPGLALRRENCMQIAEVTYFNLLGKICFSQLSPGVRDGELTRHEPLVQWSHLCPLLTFLTLLLPLGEHPFTLLFASCPCTQQEALSRRRYWLWKVSHRGLHHRQSPASTHSHLPCALCFPGFFLQFLVPKKQAGFLAELCFPNRSAFAIDPGQKVKISI